MSSETDLVEHYGGDDLVSAIEAGLAATGKAPNEATIDDLGPVDEFHVGGRPATLALCEQLGLAGSAELSVLDIGCGIGGTARCLASNFDCRVTGIDLTPAYVEAARTLSGWTGLTGRVAFEAGSALAMPFPDDSFDVAVMLHVGMNIEDKAALFAEAARVLRPGGRFGVYDIVRQGPGDIAFPVPWATTPAQSFVAEAASYRSALEAAGFTVTERNRHAFAVEFFERMSSRAGSQQSPPPIGLHLVIGQDAPAKLANLRAAVLAGTLAPTEFIATLPCEGHEAS